MTRRTRFTRLVLVAWLLPLLAGCSSGGSGLPTVPVADWPRFRHDNAHSGQGAGDVGRPRATPLSIPVDPEEPRSPVISSPVIGIEGNVYIASDAGTVLSTRPDGSVRWRLQSCSACPPERPAFGSIRSTPTLLALPEQTPVLWFGDEDGRVYAIEDRPEGPLCTLCFDAAQQTGVAAARFSAPPLLLTHPVTTRLLQVILPAAVRETTASDEKGLVWSISTRGEVLWQYPPSGFWEAAFVSSPALVLGNQVLVSSTDGYLHLLAAAEGGMLRWRAPIGPWTDPDTPVALAPVVTSTALYVNTVDGTVRALAVDRPQTLWRRSFENTRFASSLALGSHFLPTETPTPLPPVPTPTPGNNRVHNVAGQTAETSPSPALATPTATASPTATPIALQAVLFGLTKDGRLIALRTRDGGDAPLGDAQQAIEGSVLSSPALSGDGYLVFATSEGILYAIDNGTGLPAWPPIRLTQAPVRSSAAIAANGVIWIGADDGNLYRIGAQ